MKNRKAFLVNTRPNVQVWLKRFFNISAIRNHPLEFKVQTINNNVFLTGEIRAGTVQNFGKNSSQGCIRPNRSWPH